MQIRIVDLWYRIVLYTDCRKKLANSDTSTKTEKYANFGLVSNMMQLISHLKLQLTFGKIFAVLQQQLTLLFCVYK